MTIAQSERLWDEVPEKITWEEIEYNREVRLSHYKSGKRDFAESIEEVLLGGDDPKLYEMLRFPLNKKAKNYENRWENSRLSQHDFESAFWEETWNVIEDRKWRGPNGTFLLYETLCLAWDRRAIDVIRFATREKGKIDASVLPLADGFEEYYPDTRINVETEVINKLIIEQILSVELLTPEAKQLLEIMRRYPKACKRWNK